MTDSNDRLPMIASQFEVLGNMDLLTKELHSCGLFIRVCLRSLLCVCFLNNDYDIVYALNMVYHMYAATVVLSR